MMASRRSRSSLACCGKVVDDDERPNVNMEGQFQPSPVRALLFMVNSGSGVGKGTALFEYVVRNPASFKNGVWHAIDLQRFAKAETIDDAAQELADWLDVHENVRIAVAGGDGSVKWVISLLSSLDLKNPVPPVAHMPVGTGNELSRVTGWGIDNIWGTKKLNQYAEAIFRGDVYDLDIWNVDITSPQPLEGDAKDDDEKEGAALETFHSSTPVVHKIGKHQKMIGFLTFGLDADIAMKYDTYREALKRKGHPPSNIYKARAIHVVWGLEKLFSRGDDVSAYFKLTCDGQEVALPKGIQNLMFHNCHTSSGGTYYWGHGQSSKKDLVKEFSPPSTCDGLLEVSCIRSMAHLTGSKLNISHARRVAQASQIELEFLQDVPSELDGEPWVQVKGSKIRVTLDEKSPKIRLIGGPNRSLNMGIRSEFEEEQVPLESIPENEELVIDCGSADEVVVDNKPADCNNLVDNNSTNSNFFS